MYIRVVLLSIILFVTSFLHAQTTDLLISEVVEGSSNNKYVEIYNGTGASVNLANYALRLYFNGSATPGATINLSGTLTNGNVYVVAHSSAVAWGGTPDLSTGSLSFNGDDAIELYNTSTASMVDLVGNIGCDPGSEWNSGGNSTADNTIVRNANVCSGVTTDPGNSPCDFPTLAGEWTQSAQDDVSNLGSHTNSCSAPCVPTSEPTTNASTMVFSNMACFSMDLSWTSGNGANRIVVASAAPITGTPSDQTLYIANATFGLGSTIAANEYVVYNGSGNSVSVSGLSSSTMYYFAVFEYNGTTANCDENYLITSVLKDNDTTATCSCPEITGILVDACGGSVEGINEFFTFQNGGAPMYIDSLTATFPSGGSFCNSGCGAQTWTTNPAFVAQLNTTAACPGLFVEADPIPANAEVIVFTGASPTYNFDFSGLCGTGPYYAVFANNTNTGGRFANYNSTCSVRTLNVDFGSSCADAASYDRCLLSNNDGDYVAFDAPGNATYLNDGCTPMAILPVEWLSFTGKNTAWGNVLEWTTQVEINNDHFTVERATNTFKFQEIGTVKGNGNTFSPTEYLFTDHALYAETYYYRLKQTDFNGHYSYSSIISISGEYRIEIYYNASTNELVINDRADKILIHNLQGQMVREFNQIDSNIPVDLPMGMYLITTITGNNQHTQKIVLH
ncbi:MAG: lamin tail domain-containing protein [Flavobacteriales bacterium]|nr:lamin tail domain-containing protein [Flavobacteriales bacterium]